jgi:hypothetical protein
MSTNAGGHFNVEIRKPDIFSLSIDLEPIEAH